MNFRLFALYFCLSKILTKHIEIKVHFYWRIFRVTNDGWVHWCTPLVQVCILPKNCSMGMGHLINFALWGFDIKIFSHSHSSRAPKARAKNDDYYAAGENFFEKCLLFGDFQWKLTTFYLFRRMNAFLSYLMLFLFPTIPFADVVFEFLFELLQPEPKSRKKMFAPDSKLLLTNSLNP